MFCIVFHSLDFADCIPMVIFCGGLIHRIFSKLVFGFRALIRPSDTLFGTTASWVVIGPLLGAYSIWLSLSVMLVAVGNQYNPLGLQNGNVLIAVCSFF